MYKEPLVSILMNCFNGEEYLREAIDSIYAQSYVDFEIIFVDNCSSDSSAVIAKSYDYRLKYYLIEKTISIGKARNWAMQFVKGMYLAFLDVDDLWLPQKLQLQVEALERNRDYTFCYTGNYFIDEHSKITGKRIPKSRSGNVFSSLLAYYDVNMQSVLIRFDRSFCYFNESYSYSEDYELLMRLASVAKACVLPDVLVEYRIHSNSETSKKIDRWWVELKMTLDSIFDDSPELRDKYTKEVRLAYAKVAYYKSLYEYYIGNDKLGRSEIKKVRFRRLDYFILYILSLLPFDLWRKVHRRLGKVHY